MRISDWSSDVCSSDLGLFGLKGWARSSAALPHGLRRRRLQPENEGAEQVGIRTGGSEGNADAASTFYDARSDLEQPQAQGGKLRACQSSGPGHRLLDATSQPVCGSVQYQRSEEDTSELQSLMRISHAVVCLNKKKY